MSAAVPIWRRMGTTSAAARITAFITLIAVTSLIALLIAAPIYERWEEAKRKAASLDQRTAALTAAAADRLAEAEIAAPPAAALAEAGAYLNEYAPTRDREAAMLDLISSLRLIAQASDVRLTAAAPLDPDRAGGRLFDMAEDAGVALLLAEARIVADHAGLARFLEAVDKARPALRAASLDLTARTPRADQEADRLTARIIVGAMIRDVAK